MGFVRQARLGSAVVLVVGLWLALGEANADHAGFVYDKLPMSFEPNHGQTEPSVEFLARGDGYTVFLTSTEAVLKLRQHVVHMSLADANRQARVAGQVELPGKINYL